MIKQLATFAVININGGDRLTFTYDTIDETTGEPVSRNEKESFYAVDPELQYHINEIRNYIRKNKLSD